MVHMLVERLASSMEGDAVEVSKRRIGFKRRRAVRVSIRNQYLVLDALTGDKKNETIKAVRANAGTTAEVSKPAPPGTMVAPGAVRELSAKARCISLEGAVFRNESTERHQHRISVTYVRESSGDRKKGGDDKVQSVLLEFASAQEHAAWSRALERASAHRPTTRADFEVKLILGAGHFGRVSLVEHVASGSVLALKEMKEEQSAAAQLSAQRRQAHKARRSSKGRTGAKRTGGRSLGLLKLEKQISERLLLGQLADDRWVARLAFAFRERGKLFLAQEFSARGDLWSLIRHKKRLGLDSARFITAEVVAAVGSLHEHGIMHRDIKLENIMLDADGHIKLIDLGLSKLLAQRPSVRGDDRRRFGFTFSLCGTRYYMSPEQIKGTGHNLNADWWQVGCLLFELLVGKPAFYDRDPNKIDAKIISGEGANLELLRKVALETTSAAAAAAAVAASGDDEGTEKDSSVIELEAQLASDLVQSLLTSEPADRLGAAGAADVRRHDFFAGLSWTEVDARQAPLPAELAAYIDTGKPEHVVDTEVVAQFFRDAKTLEGRKLKSVLSRTAGSASSDESAAPRSPRAGARLGGSNSSTSTVTTEKLQSTDSQNTVSTRGSTSVSGSASANLKPKAPKRSEVHGPLLGYDFAASKDALADIGQGLQLLD